MQVALLFDKNGSPISAKVDEALNLISKYDSRRYLQIKRDVKRIWIAAAPGYCAEWMDELQMCILDANYFRQADISAAEMALSIVHEAIHARLCKLKIGYTENIRERVERICIKSEIAFAKRLPNGQKLVEMAESKLEMPKSYWTNGEFQKRDLDELTELGKENWLVRLLHPIIRRKVEKRNARLQLRNKD